MPWFFFHVVTRLAAAFRLDIEVLPTHSVPFFLLLLLLHLLTHLVYLSLLLYLLIQYVLLLPFVLLALHLTPLSTQPWQHVLVFLSPLSRWIYPMFLYSFSEALYADFVLILVRLSLGSWGLRFLHNTVVQNLMALFFCQLHIEQVIHISILFNVPFLFHCLYLLL